MLRSNPKDTKEILVIAHDIRSAYNVGSIFRTSEGLGVKKLIITGYSPYPKMVNDNRLPHIVNNIDRRIQKTALGSQDTLQWEYKADVIGLIKELKVNKFIVVALEQTSNAVNIQDFKYNGKLALVLGSEVQGIDRKVLSLADKHVQIPMLGKKESFNVANATAMALFQLVYYS